MERVIKIGIPVAVLMLLVWSSIMLAPLAVAQPQGRAADREHRRDEVRDRAAERNSTEYRNAFKVHGYGVAVEKESGAAHRSRIGFAGVIEREEGSAIHIDLKRGGMAIGSRDGPMKFGFDAETWNGILTNRERFSAEGAVVDQDGNSYRVSLQGEKLGKTTRGTITLLRGTFAGDGLTYELTYIAVVVLQASG